MKILSILTADKSTVAANKAKRKANALRRKQESLIDSLEDEKDTLLAKKETLETVTIDTVKEDSWAKEYQQVKIDLLMKNKEVEVAKATLLEFFTEGTEVEQS